MSGGGAEILFEGGFQNPFFGPGDIALGGGIEGQQEGTSRPGDELQVEHLLLKGDAGDWQRLCPAILDLDDCGLAADGQRNRQGRRRGTAGEIDDLQHCLGLELVGLDPAGTGEILQRRRDNERRRPPVAGDGQAGFAGKFLALDGRRLLPHDRHRLRFLAELVGTAGDGVDAEPLLGLFRGHLALDFGTALKTGDYPAIVIFRVLFRSPEGEPQPGGRSRLRQDNLGAVELEVTGKVDQHRFAQRTPLLSISRLDHDLLREILGRSDDLDPAEGIGGVFVDLAEHPQRTVGQRLRLFDLSCQGPGLGDLPGDGGFGGPEPHRQEESLAIADGQAGRDPAGAGMDLRRQRQIDRSLPGDLRQGDRPGAGGRARGSAAMKGCGEEKRQQKRESGFHASFSF